MRFFITLLLLLSTASCVLAQRWQKFSPDQLSGDRRILPKSAAYLSTDGETLRQILRTAPHERDLAAEASPLLLKLPAPDGTTLPFHIVAYDLAAPGTPDRYDHIRTYYGSHPDRPGQTVFLDWTSRGFHASVRGGGLPTFFVDPLLRGDTDHYQAYFRNDLTEDMPFSCLTGGGPDSLVTTSSGGKALGDCELMQYRTTISATGEYSNYHGASSATQSALVQSAVVTSVNRVNQVLTHDLSLRLQLVANNDLLYYYNPDTDPYTGGSVGDLISENTPNVNSVIGRPNYDYGHVYTRGPNNGVAYLRASCGSSKAGGATSRQTPEGDPFDIDYVAHEMGHNFGGNHTQNNSCNYSSSAGMEPGSGSSIMGYAGICSPNVQANSDDYFHGRSIEEITTHLEFGSGGCGTTVSMALTSPSVTAQSDHHVPAGTPLVLRAQATGDGTLSYNWEQYDTEQGTMPPEGTSVSGPLFRSLDPVPSPERYLPALPTVIAGVPSTWEVTPLVSRTLDFRATVRNFNATYGCAAEDDITLTVDGNRGPFLVSDPNQANQWSAGQIAQVQWEVAGTDQAPISSAVVDILLSTDGGDFFQTLLSNTPNDGYAEVQVPDLTSSAARIMVRSADNVFYNVSTLDFTIVPDAGAADFSLRALSPTSLTDCFQGSDETVFSFVTNSTGGASAPIDWTIDNLPGGVTATYSPNPTRPGGYFEVTLSGLSNLPVGTTQLELSGSSAEGNDRLTLSLERTGQDGVPGPATLGPGGQDVDLRPVLLGATAGNSTYDIQLASDPGFTTLLYSQTGLSAPSFQLPDYLAANTTYHWRIRSSSDQGCGVSFWTVDQFTTGDCRIYSSTADPQTISDGQPDQVAEMLLLVEDLAFVGDLDLYQLDIDHSYISDLNIDLISAAGTAVRVWNRDCGNQDNFFTSFDDEATAPLNCPPVLGNFLPPADGQLSDFDGAAANGAWTLRVTDRANLDGGRINGFSLKICLENATLPVTWLSFTAEGRKDHIALDWRTTDEVDNYGFFIERRAEGASDWTELGFVAAGDRYAFADHHALPATDYYYRLRQQDLDGRVHYSELRTARFDEGRAAGLRVFPNPTDGRLNYRLAGATDLRYDLLDVSGRRLATGVLATGGGLLDLSDRPAGVYYLRTTGAGEVATLRLVRL